MSGAEQIAAQVTFLAESGRLEEARRLGEGALRRSPDAVLLRNALAVALVRSGRTAEAAGMWRGCVAAAPAEGMFLANLANAGVVGRDHAGAARWFRRAHAMGLVDAGSLGGLGIALNALKDYEPAAHAFAQVLAQDPISFLALLGLGHSVVHIGRARDALAPLRRALAMAPADGRAWKTIGAAYVALDIRAQAIAAWRRCLGAGLSDPEVFASLADAHRVSQDVRSAMRAAHGGIALYPEDAGAWEALANTLLYCGETEAARTAMMRSLACDPTRAKTRSNLLFVLAYDPDLPNERLFAAYRAWERIHAEPLYGAAPAPKSAPLNGRRLRIGYISAEFRDHPIAHLTEGLFAHHDRHRVEVYGYADVDRPDHVTQRMAATADGWRSLAAMTDEKAADAIRADGIDVLVMLGAHTGRNRPLILARRPAPLLVTMHDLSTSGLRAVDAWLTDAVLHPPGATEGHTEELVRLPSLYLHKVPERSPDVSPPPFRDAGFVTFGSFSIPPKLNPRVLGLWAKILAAVPGARLSVGHNAVYGDPLVAARFRGRCEEAGLPWDRVDLMTTLVDRQGHLARVGRLDIALDPFPFNGGITTFEALWMGVPAVTLDGWRFAARGCASHLVQVGLGHLIAPSEDAYVAAAVDLARSPDTLAEIRTSLRSRVLSSRLCDAATYARTVEDALIGLWERRGRPRGS